MDFLMAQWYMSLTVCVTAAATAVLAFALWVLRVRPWCSCSVCLAYATSSWELEFDNLCDWYAHLLRESPGRTVHIHVLGNIITANRANVEHMLRSRFDNYPKGRPFASVLGDFLGRGIFNSDGHQWLFQRKLASLELGSSSVRSYAFGIIKDEVADRLLPLLGQAAKGGSEEEAKASLDLQDVFRRFSFDTICKISFGLDPGCLQLSLPMSEFAAAFDLASGLSAARAATLSPVVWKLKRLLNVGSERRLRGAIRLVDELANEVIRQRRKELMACSSSSSSTSTQRHDLLTRFMGSVSDEKYLRDIVVSFLLAGRDTVSSALTTFFYLLSRHPEAEADVLRDVRGASSTTPSLEELREMHYLHAAIYESLRLYPPVQLDSKFAAGEDVLPDGTYVRGGTRVSFHPYAMGRLPEAWGKDCMEFRPNRWLDAETGKFVPPESAYKFPVFQAGLRVCLGQELAIMECKAVVAAVVREFEIQPVGHERSLKFSPGLTATLRGGLPAVVRRRVHLS